MKKVLMVGAGIGQLYLSKKVKERGDYLIAVTLPGNQPVIKIADKVYYQNVFDKEAVLKIAQEESVDAVVSDQNDRMMPTVAYVSEKMNLPGLRIDQVDSFCNKNRFRDLCDDLGIPVPPHLKVEAGSIPEKIPNLPFPRIVKPADSQSSLGVRKVWNEAECHMAIVEALEYSSSKTAIVESFFEGKEVAVEGFVYKGDYYHLGIGDRTYFDLENLFIPSQTIFPSCLDDVVVAKILDCEKRLAKHVNPEFAITHSEYLYNPDTQEICIVESALRGGGMYISSHLIPFYAGIDPADLLLDCATRKELDMPAIFGRKTESSSAYVSFYLPEGKIVDIKGLSELKELPGVKMLFLDDVKVGCKTTKISHKGQRMGPIIFAAKNRESLENTISELQSVLSITVDDTDGVSRGIIWS